MAKKKSKPIIKPTGGVWMVAENGIDNRHQYTVLSNGSSCIADVYRRPKNKEAEDAEALANARLISASPDLLEAAQEVVSSHTNSAKKYAALSKLSSAITKATS